MRLVSGRIKILSYREGRLSENYAVEISERSCYQLRLCDERSLVYQPVLRNHFGRRGVVVASANSLKVSVTIANNALGTITYDHH